MPHTSQSSFPLVYSTAKLGNCLQLIEENIPFTPGFIISDEWLSEHGITLRLDNHDDQILSMLEKLGLITSHESRRAAPILINNAEPSILKKYARGKLCKLYSELFRDKKGRINLAPRSENKIVNSLREIAKDDPNSYKPVEERTFVLLARFCGAFSHPNTNESIPEELEAQMEIFCLSLGQLYDKDSSLFQTNRESALLQERWLETQTCICNGVRDMTLIGLGSIAEFILKSYLRACGYKDQGPFSDLIHEVEAHSLLSPALVHYFDLLREYRNIVHLDSKKNSQEIRDAFSYQNMIGLLLNGISMAIEAICENSS